MTLFEELKATTRNSHDRLETKLDLLSPDLTLRDYRRILERFWGVYLPVENAIQKSQLNDVYSERWKKNLLRDDLLALGMTADDIEKLPLNEDMMDLKNLTELLGTLYVLEGSSLGALILTKHFRLRFNLDDLNGLAFFSGYGEKTMKMWKEWRETSENIAKNENLAHAEIINQANKTFTILRNWLCNE